MDKKRNRFISAASVLPPRLFSILASVPESITDKAQEIILRVNRPLCVQTPEKRYYFTENNCVTDTILDSQMVVLSSREMFETFQNMCNYSVYSRQNEINSGFITLKAGHRAGICGSAVLVDKKITNIKDVTTINIRIAKEIFGCSNELFRRVELLKGVLICGAPCSGKTTILRDLARQLSYKYKVSLIDERSELASVVNGDFQNDIGLCDVFDGYIKSEAITQALRTMSPDIIVCDELSTESDVEAVKQSLNSGVAFIATMHADSIETLKKRPIARRLISTQAFSYIVFLDSREKVGAIKDIVESSSISGDFND